MSYFRFSIMCCWFIVNYLRKHQKMMGKKSLKQKLLQLLEIQKRKIIITDEDELKEEPVIEEVHEEIDKENLPVKKTIPSNYYLSGKTLVYEEKGKDTHEINLISVKRIIKTVNKAGNVVKIIVATDDVQCILIKMKNIDIEEVANLLHNKMLSIDESFNEEVEYKEY